jgi:hypothetical protein
MPPADDHQKRLMQLYEQMVQLNLDNERTLPSSLIDSLMTEFSSLNLGERIAAWADYFWRRGDVAYLFGLEAGGYAKEGHLVDDFATDCVLFFYRTTELGRTGSALEAVQFAFGTRFYGAMLEEAVQEDGRIDYSSPVHLDYSLEILRSGMWGRDVTDSLGVCEMDQAGSVRYEPKSVSYLPKERIRYAALRSGDIVFFVSDESTPPGRKLREAGAMIGHMGILRVESGRVMLIHAAAQGLGGLYEGGRVAKVGLRTYLERVETFKGIMVARLSEL